jgi:hypothetical protein
VRRFFPQLGLVFVLAASAAHAATPRITLPVSANNFTVRLTLTGQHLQAEYGGESAPDGRQFLVLNVRWEDMIDRALAKERNLPIGAKDDNLAESLSLVIDDTEAIPVFVHEVDTAHLNVDDPDMVGRSGGATDAYYIRKVIGIKNAAGQRSIVYLNLSEPGAMLAGDMLFPVPVGAKWHRLELTYHNPTGSDFRLPFFDDGELPPAPSVEADPPGTQTNEVLALAARLQGDVPASLTPAPAGRRYAVIDFSGRSLLKVQDAYPPYDPAHKPEETFWRPDPASWSEFHNMVQLVADGTLPCAAVNADALPETAEFRTSPRTHLQLIYLVPATTRTLELECFFPSYQIPGIDGDVTPKLMRFHLAGPAAAPVADGKTEHTVVDGPMEFRVNSHAVASAFGGQPADEGQRFLVVDFGVRNSGNETMEFKSPERLVWFKPPDAPEGTDSPHKFQEKRNGAAYNSASAGEEVETAPDEITARGPLAPPDFFYLEPGATRVFQVVWSVPVGLAQARLGIKGNTVADAFTLSLPAKTSSPP